MPHMLQEMKIVTQYARTPTRSAPRISKARSQLSLFACGVAAILCCGSARAQSASEPGNAATDSSTQAPETVQDMPAIDVNAQRQTALDTEALTISETPEAGSYPGHRTEIVGFGPMIAPAYEGAKKTKVQPFPYVDIRGLFHNRVFLSAVNGVGFNLLNEGPFRAGLTLGYNGGRTSKDDPHLNGMPDISGAAEVGGFATLRFKPFALEARVGHRLGSTSGTEVAFGTSVGAAPIPALHLSLSAEVAWADARYQKLFFGVTSAEAALATADGNPLNAYTPGAGLTSASLTLAGVYQVGEHWGLVARIAGKDLLGKAAKDSPLTQRTFQPSYAFGVMYQF